MNLFQTQMLALIILIGYLLGSIPVGYLLVRTFKGIDIRKFGSRNIGMTNVWRVTGPGWGIATLILDISKGALSVGAGTWLFQTSGYAPVLGGLAALIGSVFPIFLRFKGGKAVGVSIGVFFTLLPVETACALVVFLIVFALFRMVSVGSLSAATVLGVLAFTRHGWGWDAGLALLAMLLIWWTHRENIKRILAGKENKVGRKNKA